MELRPRTRARAFLCAVAIAALGGCSSKGKSTSTDPWPIDTAPFADASPPSSYVPRVKTLLTGLPATDAEVEAVRTNPTALKGLIDGWMQLPQFRLRMLDFFRNAFQQNNVDLDDLRQSLDVPGAGLGGNESRMQFALQDMFPLTAWQLVQEGRPFNETVNGRRYRMTTALMAMLSFTDMFESDDEGDTRHLLRSYTSQRPVFDPLAAHTDGTPITPAQSAAAFGRGKTGDWVWRAPILNLSDACVQEIRDQRAGGNAGYQVSPADDWNYTGALLSLVFGNQGIDTGDGALIANSACEPVWNTDVNVPAGLLQESDWTDWRWVTLEQLPLNDDTTFPSPQFWDLATLRSATSMRLKSPHVGFLGTLAWMANWPTNASNQARVIANQALIVAIGQSIIPAAAIAPAPPSASDSAHSSDPACRACHDVLDPLRQFFRQSYTYSYHEQRSLVQYLGNAAFLVGGMNQAGTGVQGLATILASHPHFAVGWAQKLQFWANSAAALESDPELQRAAAAFAASGYDFKVLVREVFASPLVTFARGSPTLRQPGGVTIPTARRDQLCAALGARFEVEDLCHQRQSDRNWNEYGQNSQLIATDVYYRAAELPALPRNPDLFFRSSVEAVCQSLADDVVGGSGVPYISSTDATAATAITDMVARVMNIPPGDQRSQEATRILTDHYGYLSRTTQNGGLGLGRNNALRSTFVLACSSPGSVMMGL